MSDAVARLAEAAPAPPRPAPTLFEAVVRSPLGEVRVWIDPDANAVRTSLRLDYAAGEAEAEHGQRLCAIADELHAAVRRLTGAGSPSGPGGDRRPVGFGLWLSQRTTPDPAARTFYDDLWRDYLAWCDKAAQPAFAQPQFAAALTARGFVSAGHGRIAPGRQARYRGGLRLRDAMGFAS